MPVGHQFDHAAVQYLETWNACSGVMFDNRTHDDIVFFTQNDTYTVWQLENGTDAGKK
jgi:hypothetical protein